MKKIISAFAFVACLATSGLAQVVDDPSQYTSGASEPATPNMTINHVESSEPVFAISIHPITMIVYSLILDIPSIYVTIEGNINSNVSIITRPFYLGKEWSDDNEKIDLDMFGLSEGVRYYFNRGHQGLFTAFHVNYEYVSIEYDYDGKGYFADEKENATGNALGLGFYLGSKSMWGHFTTSWDIGLTYTKSFVKASSKDDIEEVSDVGVGFDINYTMGFAL